MRIDLPTQHTRADFSRTLSFIDATVFQNTRLIGRRATLTD
ncbi:hypothetical protein [Pseudomonas donghuensis]|nr:hypothetical protein [Pseudomonas donghuensis]